jgi:hypothetical protein
MEYKIQYVDTQSIHHDGSYRTSVFPRTSYCILAYCFAILFMQKVVIFRWSHLGGHISTVLYEYVASQAENKNVTTFGLYTLRATNAIISM